MDAGCSCAFQHDGLSQQNVAPLPQRIGCITSCDGEGVVLSHVYCVLHAVQVPAAA
jgi:hypothetical protein